MATELAFEVRTVFPRDPAFARATAATRRAACAALVPLVQRAYHHQLEAGIGASGEGLTHLAASTILRRRSARARRADPTAPPLIPAHALSRTNSLLRGRVLDDLSGVEMYWLTDRTTGLNWGQVIQWHKDGSTRYPPRDVMGLAPQFHPEVQAGIDHWWSLRRKEAGAPATPTPAYVPKFPERAVAKNPLAVTQFELRNELYTVGAASGPVSVASLNAAIKAGTFSGFRRLGPPPTPRITPPEPPKQPRHPKIPELRTNQQLAADARAKAAEAARKAEAERLARAAAEQARLEAERKATAARKQAETKARREAEEKAKVEEEQRQALERLRLKAEARKAEERARAEVEAEAGRESVAGAGGALATRIREIVTRPFARPSEIRREVTELVRAAQGPTVRAGFHGMKEDEDFHVVEFGGLKIHYTGTPTWDPARPVEAHPVVATLRNIAEADFPEALSRHTRELYLSTQADFRDPDWKKKYNNPDHVSAATGGGGRVVVYSGQPIYAPLLAHEMGHNLASALYGSITPKGTSAYQRAIDSGESAVSDYARTNAAEDFAEATRLFTLDEAELQRIAPLRHAVLKRLMEDPSYGG